MSFFGINLIFVTDFYEIEILELNKMNSPKFLRMFAMIEMLSAIVFISLAVITFLSLDKLGGDMMIPLVFGIIGGCALIAAPVLLVVAKKREAESNSPIEY